MPASVTRRDFSVRLASMLAIGSAVPSYTRRVIIGAPPATAIVDDGRGDSRRSRDQCEPAARVCRAHRSQAVLGDDGVQHGSESAARDDRARGRRHLFDVWRTYRGAACRARTGPSSRSSVARVGLAGGRVLDRALRAYRRRGEHDDRVRPHWIPRRTGCASRARVGGELLGSDAEALGVATGKFCRPSAGQMMIRCLDFVGRRSYGGPVGIVPTLRGTLRAFYSTMARIDSRRAREPGYHRVWQYDGTSHPQS